MSALSFEYWFIFNCLIQGRMNGQAQNNNDNHGPSLIINILIGKSQINVEKQVY